MALNHLTGPWRAIPVLGPTQILAWGALFYPPVLVMPLIAAERDWSLAFCMGGFSLGLLMAGLVAPTVGGLIDRYGGHWVMAAGALVGALGLLALALTTNRANYLAGWMAIGVAMAGSLYDPAFATLGRIFGAEARRPITILTFIGGFASTVSWPATYVLIGYLGWKGAYLVYAGLLAFAAAPLLAFALPRERFKAQPLKPGEVHVPPKTRPARGAVFILVIVAFTAYAFIPSAMSAHLLAIFDRLGIDPKVAVGLGALFGPAQVLSRLAEFLYAREIHPLVIARFAVALTAAGFALIFAFGISLWVADGLRHHVRRHQRADDDRARHGPAHAVRGRGLRQDRGPDRRPGARDAGGRPPRARLRRRAASATTTRSAWSRFSASRR